MATRLMPVLVAAALLPLTACGGLSPDADAAADVALSFHAAVSAGDGQSACDDLAPGTADVLQRDAGAGCAQAVLDEDIPDASTVLDAQAFGQVAQVVMSGDVVFLAAFGDEWRVTAAGCSPRDNKPYYCSIDGG